MRADGERANSGEGRTWATDDLQSLHLFEYVAYGLEEIKMKEGNVSVGTE